MHSDLVLIPWNTWLDSWCLNLKLLESQYTRFNIQPDDGNGYTTKIALKCLGMQSGNRFLPWHMGAHRGARSLEARCSWRLCLPQDSPPAAEQHLLQNLKQEAPVDSIAISVSNTRATRRLILCYKCRTCWVSLSSKKSSRWQNSTPWHMRLEGLPQGGQILKLIFWCLEASCRCTFSALPLAAAPAPCLLSRKGYGQCWGVESLYRYNLVYQNNGQKQKMQKSPIPLKIHRK